MSKQDDKMDIIVEAHLAKETFLAGETLSCKITVWSQSTALTNVQLEESAKFPHNFSGILSPPSTPVTPTKDLTPRKSIREKYFSSIDESLESSKERLNSSVEEIKPSPKQTSKVSHVDLLSVQVLGYYVIEPNTIKLPPSHVPKLAQMKQWLAIAPSIFGGTQNENKYLVFSTPATILGSQLCLLPVGTVQSYFYEMMLPHDLPPSCKLSGLKCTYTLVIAAQQSPNPPKTFNFPIRILNPGAAIKKLSFMSEHLFKSHFEIRSIELEPGREEGFQIQRRTQTYHQVLHETHFQNTIQQVNKIVREHSKPVPINITSGPTHLVRFCINKTVFHLGETIKGFFDFSNAELPCYQVSVRLETTQTVETTFVNPSRSTKPLVTVVSEHHEFTHNSINTSFVFNIPVSTNQEFTTEIASLHWHLFFDFTIGILGARDSTKGIEVQALQWTLPIRVIVSRHPLEHIYKSRNTAVMFTNEVTRETS